MFLNVLYKNIRKRLGVLRGGILQYRSDAETGMMSKALKCQSPLITCSGGYCLNARRENG